MTIRTRHATALVIVMLAVLVVGAGATTHTVNIGPNQQLIFSDQQTGKPTTTINVGDTVQWVWQGMHHVFQLDVKTLAGSRRALDRAAAFLRSGK